MYVTDTPIYDQVRQELRDHPRPAKARSRAADSDAGLSVWALIDRSQRAADSPRR
ncbi:hypothetical protein SAMN05192558_110321 [Actinokineospora alba]|uniref:Uncharacterized protein n=1 Tax=Actinokineospora alba TaxID=504798 RepID=A0A1H0U105_9PSEU|nr:hypothetical protein C8E96_6469 [Actinokineospora alba]SDJ17759.1 hypothetical protein SAMN05421871_110321 [Actinokineospora alba]SDP59849.1 hypothetical protein SAMN05192558_110321 [Actinokineospora alba]